MTFEVTMLPMLVGAGVFAGSIALLVTGGGKDGKLFRKRANRLVDDVKRAPRQDDASADRSAERREARRKREAARNGLFHLPELTFLRTRIARTGYTLSPWKLVVGCAVGAAIATFAVMIAAAQPPAIAIPIGLVAGFGIPYMALGFLARRRLARFVNMMPEAIDIIVRGVRAGLPVTEAIATVAREMDDPIGVEFRRIIDSYRLGRSLGQAMGDTARRLNVAEFNFLVVALSIQQETGGNLAETLSNLSDIIRKRRQLHLKVKALTGEAKASAAVVGSLPFLLFLVINYMNPEYTAIFFDEARGHMMLGTGLGLMALGLAIMYKLANFEI